MGIFKKAKSLFAVSESYESVTLIAEKHLRGEGIKVPFQGLPFQINLVSDDTRLHLYPEFYLKSQPEKSSGSFILFNPENYYSAISAFIRLERGKKLVLGRSDPEQTLLLGYSARVSRRHLSITNLGDAIVFEDLHSNAGTTLSVLRHPDEVERLTRRREAAFYQIREIFGGPIQPLALPEAHSALEKVNLLLSQEAY
ncbi:MAG: FHA domain-containing protein, partial [Deltaproteobacteria bacterium]|nr:FHA domain-containing protein [Deltaproteobacteria bacterium]